MESIVELAAQCGVVEYPHLRLTSEYEVDPDHVFYAWPSTVEENDTAMDERADLDDDLPSLVEDSDSEDDDDVEMIEAGQDREQQIEDTVRSILRCSDRPSTRDELTRLGRTPNPAGPTPSQKPAAGEDQLVTPKSLSMYEWSLLRDFGAKGKTAPSLNAAHDYVSSWNAHAKAAAARGSVDGCHYQLRKIDRQLAVDLTAFQVTPASSSSPSSLPFTSSSSVDVDQPVPPRMTSALTHTPPPSFSLSLCLSRRRKRSTRGTR